MIIQMLVLSAVIAMHVSTRRVRAVASRSDLPRYDYGTSHRVHACRSPNGRHLRLNESVIHPWCDAARSSLMTTIAIQPVLALVVGTGVGQAQVFKLSRGGVLDRYRCPRAYGSIA